jgi:hypothetical protein
LERLMRVLKKLGFLCGINRKKVCLGLRSVKI